MPPEGQPPGGAGGPPPSPPPGPPPGPPSGRPEYKVYRSRRGPLDRLREAGVGNPLEGFRRRRKRHARPGLPKPKRRITPGRVLKWVLLAVLAWVLLSAVLFFVSAAIQDGVSERTEDALANGGSLLTGSTILVIGSDARPEGTKEPTPEGGFGQRADSILLLRVGAGSVRRLSILRDSHVNGEAGYTGKINGAYSGGGGAARLIEVLEAYLGNDLEINHVIEVDFENFPDFIDALGGIDIKLKRCVKPTERFSGFGIRDLKFEKGDNHLNGRQALGFARIRKNACNPSEDDRQRAARQQQVLSGIRDQALSPSTFVRLPWVAWNAPKTVDSDMQGPGLSALFFDLMTGGSGKTRILTPSGTQGSGLAVSEDTKRKEVERLLGDD